MVKSQHESAKLLAETDAFLQITPNLALLMTVALAAAENTTHHCVGRETGRPYRCFTWEVMTETCIRWEGMEASPIPCDYPCSTEYCAQVFLPYRFFQQKKFLNFPYRRSTHHYEVVCTVATCESPAGKDDSDNNGKISSWIKISSVGGLISMTTTAVLLTLLAIRLWLKRFAPAQYARRKTLIFRCRFRRKCI